MQVNLVPTPGAIASTGNSREVLLPGLLQLLAGDPESKARHAEELEADRQRRQRRRDANRRELVAGAACPTRPSEVISKAERDMLPGSRAARQEVLHSQAKQHAGQQRRAFRRALADAGVRGQSEPSQTVRRDPGTPMQSGKAETGRSAQPGGERSGNPPGPTASDGAKPSGQQPTAHSGGEGRAALANSARPVTFANTAGACRSEAGDAGRTKPVQAVAKVSAGSGRAGRSATAAAARGSSPAPAAGARSGNNAAGVVTTARSATSARKSGPAQAAQSKPKPGGSSDANLERIVRLVHTRIDKQRSVATLRLDPPELGKIRVRLDLRDNQLGLLIETQTPAARRLLSERMDALREGLAANGIHLERVEVRMPPTTPDTSASETPQHADVPGGDGEGAAREEAGAAESGPQDAAESAFEEQAEAPVGEVALEPAAESLVNVWA